jgi:LAO/AO transport system kinase
MKERSEAIAALVERLRGRDPRAVARAISLVEDRGEGCEELLAALDEGPAPPSLILGITGAPGSGKSTLTDQLIRSYRAAGQRVGVVAIDPSSPRHGGALLGDRVRLMRHATDPDVIVRSMATRRRLGGLCAAAAATTRILAQAKCDRILVETAGVGQTEIDVSRIADVTLLVMAPGMGDDIQAMKAGLMEMADVLVVNKSDRPGAEQLAHEMTNLGHESGRPVGLTNSLDGSGISSLVASIEKLDGEQLQAGVRERRRKETRDYEVLEWAVALLRARFEVIVRQENVKDWKGDPLHRAEDLIEIYLRGGRFR